MATSTAAVHTFTADERLLFARLSGDINPMHVDPVAARRTQAGTPVVHGMYLALWAVDALLGVGCVTKPITALSVIFQKFVYDGDEVMLSRIRLTETTLRTTLTVGGAAVATLELGFGPPAVQTAALVSTLPVAVETPAVLNLPDLPGRAGWLPRAGDRSVTCLFPLVADRLGQARVEALVQLSTLVGMVCPGLHSVFAALTIKIAEAGGPDGMSFAVQSVDERFRRAEVAVSGGGIVGTVIAFVRHPPVEQRAMRDLSGLVATDEFRGSTALIVGGSRGLGALTARVLAAGGARVVITYVVGEADSREVAAEIGPDACRVLRYDARQDAADQLTQLDWDVDQLYYFATPQIFRQKAGFYVPCRFAEFCDVYVDGFERICAALLGRSTAALSVLYPSSIAVEDRPQGMTEYSMAKAAGEMLCGDMNRFLRGLTITVSRLPRILTDQTATVTPVESNDALDVMLPLIRRVHAGAMAYGPDSEPVSTG